MGKMTINGRTFDVPAGASMQVVGGQILINGAPPPELDGRLPAVLHIKVEGTLASLVTDLAVECADVQGDVKAGGNVNCGAVGGSVTAGRSINCDNVGGDVAAQGSVNCGHVAGNVKGK